VISIIVTAASQRTGWIPSRPPISRARDLDHRNNQMASCAPTDSYQAESQGRSATNDRSDRIDRTRDGAATWSSIVQQLQGVIADALHQGFQARRGKNR
jgi:hypothetical protein